MGEQVWITGIGAVTPAGWTAAETWSAVAAGKRFGQALRRFPLFDAATKVGAPVPGRELVASEGSHAIEFGIAAAGEALTSAGLAEDEAIDVAIVATHGERQLPGPGRPAQLGKVADIVAAVQGRANAARRTALYGACAGGGLAVGSAAKLIRSGQADIVLAGGTDNLLREIDFFSFCSLYAMTSRDCPPEEASAPFDARRDGFLLAEGSGFVVLESERHARARGAERLATVDGFGFSQNAYHMVASPPDALGPQYAMQRALDDAQLNPADIDYINAHGTSTRDNDWCETLAIRQAFGAEADGIPVSSVKGVLGHSMASAGAIETVLCVQALRDQIAPPTANITVPDPKCDLDYIPNGAREMKLDKIVNNSFGFGGHNASLILGKG
ncbi:3-oxoacyl-[acyl-carrier-protein] synthase II [Amycolatopsis xylanica]|uniref:3-oxoacyl-[acyl-carrier-protein] synthase II n=1 Tax=Amycolatopsis xylanica TaxID=589385 RepID=A0A1H3PFR1_9PSEU|nr:beta-ketoacyl-[acyl-carrier-protein] synthase family protein [Amycolatopsis xylanica]SDZ00002.1 3-oxoacyl-[acyl-carrier-protein] synthase II [Amycolatopsis xylanica]